jgi:hypothetical protein
VAPTDFAIMSCNVIRVPNACIIPMPSPANPPNTALRLLGRRPPQAMVCTGSTTSNLAEGVLSADPIHRVGGTDVGKCSVFQIQQLRGLETEICREDISIMCQGKAFQGHCYAHCINCEGSHAIVEWGCVMCEIEGKGLSRLQNHLAFTQQRGST